MPYILYSTGLIWGHCHQNKKIIDNYKLDGWFYYREPMEEIIERLDNPSVIGFSDFVWNTQYDHKISKKIKESVLEKFNVTLEKEVNVF